MDAANPKPSNTAFVGLVAAMAEVIANNDGESPWGFCPACNGMPLYGEPRCLMCRVEKLTEASAEMVKVLKAALPHVENFNAREAIRDALDKATGGEWRRADIRAAVEAASAVHSCADELGHGHSDEYCDPCRAEHIAGGIDAAEGD